MIYATQRDERLVRLAPCLIETGQFAMIYAAKRDGGLSGLPSSMKENGGLIGDKRTRHALDRLCTCAPCMDSIDDPRLRKFVSEAPQRKKMHLGDRRAGEEDCGSPFAEVRELTPNMSKEQGQHDVHQLSRERSKGKSSGECDNLGSAVRELVCEWSEGKLEGECDNAFGAVPELARELPKGVSEGERFVREGSSLRHAAVHDLEMELSRGRFRVESEERRFARKEPSNLGFAELGEEKASDGLFARFPVRSEYVVDVAERVDQTFDMPAQGLGETLEEDGSVDPTSLPAAETEHTDMEVDPSKYEGPATDDMGDSGTQERVRQSNSIEREVAAGLDDVGRQIFKEFAGNNWAVPADYLQRDVDREGLGDMERETFEELGGNNWSGGDREPRHNRERDTPQNRPAVEVIDLGNDSDDEPPIEMHACESAGSSTEGTKPVNRHSSLNHGSGFSLSGRHRGLGFSFSTEFTSDSCSQEEGSDSDDCRVVDSWHQNQARPSVGTRVNGQPIHVTDDEDEESDSDDSISVESDSSDIEVVDGSQSNIRKMWEAAAMRRRMGRAMRSEGSKANGEHEDTANLDAERPGSQGLAESVATSTYRGSPDSKEQTETSEARVGEEDLRALDESQGRSFLFEDEEPPALTSGGDEINELIVAREKLKETPHYRMSDAAEWASRQEEIQRQALESQRLRQRKRAEADRKKEMERKQRQRVEDLRLSQKKEERYMGLREQLRVQVREELEQIAANCSDLATLLRRLGIPVDGGNFPSSQQVNSAYKKALFKFHPDRAVQGDPRRQVEAEEKFKLISRMKNTLVPVAIDYSNGFR